MLVYIVFAVVYTDAVPFFKSKHHRHYYQGRGWVSSHTKTVRGSHHNQLSVVNFPRRGSTDSFTNDTNTEDTKHKKKRLVIIIDVDNTLYSEQQLLSATGHGIETQIIQNTHLFGQLHCNLSSEECNELYKKYGSTIEGLRYTLPSHQVDDIMSKFYKEVYDPIDFSCLLGIIKNNDTIMHKLDSDTRSGYDHGNALQQRRALSDFLQSLTQSHTVYLASNSPKAHIQRVVNNMGLGDVDFADILSPDMNNGIKQSGKEDDDGLIYPTKSSPAQYYKHILQRHPLTSNRLILLDDSLYNLQQAKTVGIEGMHINERTLEEGLAQALGHILPPDQYTFSDVEYLQAKNVIDMNSINPLVWEQLARELALRIQQQNSNVLHIADLGAGMISMLDLILNGGGNKEDRKKPSLISLITTNLDPDSNQLTKLEYYAYESNLNLLQGSKERLLRMGFQQVEDITTTFRFLLSKSSNDIEITVHLLSHDFQDEQKPPPKELDLIIGCCFADLFEPDQLALSLQRFALGSDSDRPPLIYFPITFAGHTQFDPAYPSTGHRPNNSMIPSDTTAFRMYSDSLTSHGHNLEPSLIESSIKSHGGSLITKGSSDWIIDPSSDTHLWETMLYFFGMSGAREMTKYYLDAASWIEQCRLNPRTIVVSNVDLLFHLKANPLGVDKDTACGESSSNTVVTAQEIQFVAPYNVTTVEKSWDASNLDPDQVEIESLCSLISSGTELKIFKGSFDAASLDVNIKGLADKSMEYPLAYGYSLVGRIVACGSNVDKSLIGRLAFTFSPHSTRLLVDSVTIQLVPDGMSAEDAVFFPSVETALSLVHDANVRLGENVAIYGQGKRV